MRGRLRRCLWMLLAGLTCLPANAGQAVQASAEPSDARRAELERALLPAVLFVDRPMPEWTLAARMDQHRVPGVAIALIEDGRIAWSQGYGRTRSGDGAAVTQATRFQAASLAKLITAVTALRLVEQGRLSLDQDVNAVLASWKVPSDPAVADTPVTPRHLLSHRAGTTVRGFRGYDEGEALPGLRQILAGQVPANSPAVVVDAVPGSRERYSGGGYMVLQQVVEDATSRPFAEVADELVLGPAGMRAVPGPALPAGEVACGHGHGGDPVPGCARRYPEIAAAGWWATPKDFALLAIALSRAFLGEDEGLLGADSAHAMLARTDGSHMGLGPGVHGAGRHLHFDHAGWNHGFRSRLLMYPRLGQGIVVMANGDGADGLIEEIVRAAAHVYRWPDFQPRRLAALDLGPELLDAHVGEYRMSAGFAVTIEREGGRLRVSTPRGTVHEFHPLGPDRFIDPEDGAELVFEPASDATAAGIGLWGMQGRRDPADPGP